MPCPYYFLIMNQNFISTQGVGAGLRSVHYPVVTSEWPQMDWFEAISENYMDTGGRPLHILEKVREHYPIALHGTSLSIGSVDPLDPGYLTQLKKLVERIQPFIVSDHLCWCGVGGEALHDLLPLPLTGEALNHVVRRVDELQEFLGRKILLENVSTYVTYKHSTMPEWEFLTEVARRSGSGILLDLNNLYVNSFNHKFDPHEYLKNVPAKFVGQFHLAGHTDRGSYLFDTHSDRVIEPVWQLYREALQRIGPVSTLIEWDENIPAWEELAEEVARAREIYNRHPEPATESMAGEGSLAKDPSAASRLQDDATRPPLLQTQRWMKSRIQPNEQEGLLSDPEKTLLNPQGDASGEERMNVYASGYVARIRETLIEVYGTIRRTLGDGRFDEAAKAYAFRYPSQNYNLNFAGRHFPDFLKDFAPARPFPFLSDLARLEWLIWESFHAFDGPSVQSSELAGIALEKWENTRLAFQPSVRILASSWPVLDLWAAKQSPEAPPKGGAAPRPQWILISRKEDQVRCELIDEPRYHVLKSLLSGETLGRACEVLAEKLDEEIPPVSQWFSHWIQEGLIGRPA